MNTKVGAPILGTRVYPDGIAGGVSASPKVAGSARAHEGLMVLGMVLATVGWIDVLLNLFPPAIGNAEWELGTVSLTIDALPLGTLGLGLAVVGAALARRPTWMSVLAALAVVGTLFVVATAGLYALAFPVVWGALGEPMRGPFLLATGKTAVFGSIYVVFYAWLGAFAWTHARRIRDSTP